MKSHSSEKTRFIVVHGAAGDALVPALARVLDAEAVACGWVRGSGVLRDVELAAYDGGTGRPASSRRIAGPVQAVTLEGSVGLANGEVSVGLRAVLARETDRGMETLAGELVSARVVAFEALVTAFDDLALARAVDPQAGIAVLAEPGAAATAPEAPPAGSPAATWSEAIAASPLTDASRGAARPSPSAGNFPMPPRPVRARAQEEQLVPEPGDHVEHFAFGPADVIKSDGERLHLRVHKDGRMREIALEMLRVTLLDGDAQPRRFKLERKL